MKPHDTFEDVTVEIIAIDSDKPDMLVWRCTEEQGYDWEEIRKRVTSQGYSAFEKKKITEVTELFEIEKEKEENKDYKLEKYKSLMQLIVSKADIRNREKYNKLSELLSDMSYDYGIPIFYSQEFEEKNNEVMKVFKEIIKHAEECIQNK